MFMQPEHVSTKQIRSNVLHHLERISPTAGPGDSVMAALE